MSIVQQYEFHGGSDGGLAAAINLQNMAAVMTSTFQFGGDDSTNPLKHLGIPAGLVLSTAKEVDHAWASDNIVEAMPEEMFNRMLALVSPDGKKIKPVFTRRKQLSKEKREGRGKRTRRL